MVWPSMPVAENLIAEGDILHTQTPENRDMSNSLNVDLYSM